MNVSLAISVGRGFQKCLGNFWKWHMCKLGLPLKASLLLWMISWSCLQLPETVNCYEWHGAAVKRPSEYWDWLEESVRETGWATRKGDEMRFPQDMFKELERKIFECFHLHWEYVYSPYFITAVKTRFSDTWCSTLQVVVKYMTKVSHVPLEIFHMQKCNVLASYCLNVFSWLIHGIAWTKWST